MHENPDLIRIATGFGTLDTYALKSYLNGYGIEVMLDNSHFSAALPHYVFATQGVNMWVFTSDWPAAKELLESYRCDNQKIQDSVYANPFNNVTFVVLWVVLMFLCLTPPPARGIYFTHPKMIARILIDENDKTATKLDPSISI